MAEKFVIKAEVRETRGKNEARRMRAQGKVPVSIYGGGEANTAATVELKDLAAILRTDAAQNTVFDLEIAGIGTSSVMFQDRQIDPIKGRLIHADLRRIGKGEKLEMTVPIHLVGKPEALTEEGAVLNQALRSIRILVEPSKAPEYIDVDISGLSGGHAIHVSDLKSAGYEVLEADDVVIASINTVKASSLEASTETGAQPEVVGEKKAE
jgi:large subunit ribosomal protein L25